MTKTTNYQLNQWDAADPVRREDFNADNAKLDAALKATAAAASSAAAAVAAKGNCSVEIFSYIGTGSGGATLEFSAVPAAFLIVGGDVFVAGIGNAGYARSMGTNNGAANVSISVTWSGKTAQLTNGSTAALLANYNGNTYYVAAFYRQS